MEGVRYCLVECQDHTEQFEGLCYYSIYCFIFFSVGNIVVFLWIVLQLMH